MATESEQRKNWWKTAIDFDCWDDLRFPASTINPLRGFLNWTSTTRDRQVNEGPLTSTQ